jgi:hypothetical protein
MIWYQAIDCAQPSPNICGNWHVRYLNIVNITFVNYTSEVPPSTPCIYVSGNWNIIDSVCNITINTNLGLNNLTIANSTIIINASITNFTTWWEGNNSQVKEVP